MSVAIRTATRLQDQDDVNVTPAVGVDEYALTYDHDTGKFVLRAPAAAPDLSGYALLAGRAGGQTLYGGTAANDDITIHGTSDATRTTSYVLLQPSGGNVGIGTSAPTQQLQIVGTGGMYVGDAAHVNSYLTDFASNALSARGLGVLIGDAAKYAMAFQNIASGGYGLNIYANSSGTERLLAISNSSSDALVVLGNGRLGIGTTAPATILHAVSTTATTDALRNVLTLGANVTSTGVGAAGLGAAVLFTMETTTTADTSAASVQAIIYEATHATRKFDLVGNAYDTAIREGWRIRGTGSAAAIGFLGATPQARIAHVADPAGGATVDAEARSAINSILSTLELFGFHAAS